MELKATIAATSLLFLLLLTPCFSRGKLDVSKVDGGGIYDIDYRGPETHSYIPPPNRFIGRSSLHHHRQSVFAHRRPRSKGLRAAGKNGKKNRG